MLPWKWRKCHILPVTQNFSSVNFSLAKFQLVSCKLPRVMIWQMTYTHKLPKLCSATLMLYWPDWSMLLVICQLSHDVIGYQCHWCIPICLLPQLNHRLLLVKLLVVLSFVVSFGWVCQKSLILYRLVSVYYYSVAFVLNKQTSLKKVILKKKKTTTSLAKFLSVSYLLHFWFRHAHIISSQHFPVRKLGNIWRLFDKFILVHGDHGYNIECIHVLQP